MDCKICGEKAEDGSDLCPKCAETEGKSGSAFWVMAAALLVWELGVVLWPFFRGQALDIPALIMATAGFAVAAILAGKKLMPAWKFNIGSCACVLVAFLLWYAFCAAEQMALVKCGVRVYDEVNTALTAGRLVTLSALWPWAVVIVLGLAKSGKLDIETESAAVAAAVTLGLSALAVGLALNRYEADMYYARTVSCAWLSTQWLLRLAMLAVAVRYGAGRIKGIVAAGFFAAAPAVAGIVAVMALNVAAPAAAFWAISAVQAGFAIVGIELALMKKEEAKE